jgi:C4-dicarboxylate-specific signal transduction histidine kinase
MFNDAFLDSIDMEYDEVMGCDMDELNKKLCFSAVETPYDGINPAEKSNKYREASYLTPEGNRREIIYHNAPIINVDDEIIGYVRVSSDITTLKEEQKKILQQEKLALIGQMGSGIVHETKNHLASIKGYCQLLSSRIYDDQLNNYIKRIETITADVNRVIIDFLSLSKPAETIMDIVSLNEIIESMRYMLESPSFMKGVKINIVLSEDIGDIKADEYQIKQVILNMAKNAIEAMADTEEARLDIHTARSTDGNRMILTIADNGRGMPQKHIEQLGTPFFTTKDTGTGLGLSVYYRIIKEHDGYIEVMSKEGAGTTFNIFFPCYGNDEDEQAC